MRKRTGLLVAAAVVVVGAGAGVVALSSTGDDGAAPQQGSAPSAVVVATDPPKTAPPASPSAGAGSSTGAGTTPGSPAPTPSPDGSAGGEPPAAGTPTEVQVVLTYSGYSPESQGVIAGGYADSVIETTGTCTLTLTQADQTRQVSGTAYPDAASTTCGELLVSQLDLTGGKWNATLTYASATSRGTSAPTTIEVP